jgi:hypothetical protein
MNKLIEKIFNFEKSDEQYDYENAVYNIQLSFLQEDNKINPVQINPEDIMTVTEYEAKYREQFKEKVLPSKVLAEGLAKEGNLIKATQIVKPNRHILDDIFGSLFGAYEHKNENGNWVPGPALGHGYEGGYDCSWNADEEFKKLKDAVKGAFKD